MEPLVHEILSFKVTIKLKDELRVLKCEDASAVGFSLVLA